VSNLLYRTHPNRSIMKHFRVGTQVALTLGSRRRKVCTLHPYTLHHFLTPYTLYPVPYTPIPYTLYLTPLYPTSLSYTLYPVPYTPLPYSLMQISKPAPQRADRTPPNSGAQVGLPTALYGCADPLTHTVLPPPYPPAEVDRLDSGAMQRSASSSPEGSPGGRCNRVASLESHSGCRDEEGWSPTLIVSSVAKEKERRGCEAHSVSVSFT
jgi:hypothetical protein